jgi:hypothetical protein
MRISSHMLSQRAAYFSDGPTRNHRSGPTPGPRWAVCALLKTRNRLQEKLPVYLGFFAFVHNVRKRGKALLPALIELLVT